MRAQLPWVLAFALAGCAPAEIPVDSTSEGLLTEVQSFGSNPGGLKMYKYVPAGVPADAPVLFALHACSQTASAYEGAGWNALADELKFYVVYPEQQSANNPALCFNWAGEYGDPTNLMRGEGENESIHQMLDKMRQDYSIDPSRVYMSGFSGGGAQVALMLATWPDLFAGGAILAGIPYDCTTTFTEVSTCLNPGIDRSPMDWGDRVRNAFSYSGSYPIISLWQGTADTTVKPTNQMELLDQWTNVHGIDETPDVMDTVDGHPHEAYQNAAGDTLIEVYHLTGMGHGTPVLPSAGCGQTGAYFLDVGICSSRHIAEFFGLDGSVTPVDRTPPQVMITAPADGGTVMGNVSIQATASDDVGVSQVTIAINGTVDATLTAAPYSYAWDASTAANGSYLIRATATDAAGNASHADITVTVMGGIDDTTPPSVNVTAPANGAMVSGTVDVAVDASDDFGVQRVTVLVDGTSIGEATAPPYHVSFNTGSVSPGAHAISATAVDAAGNTATDADTTVMVTAGDTTPPTVSIISPTDGAVLSGVVNISVASSDDTHINSVLMFLDGELIGTDYRGPSYEFLWDTAQSPEGPHELAARAFDDAGNMANDSISISVMQDGQDPDAPGGKRVLAGKRFWGCATTPAEPGGLLILLGVLFFFRRRR